jgi:hypothetical protein
VTLKSLADARQANPQSVGILILQGVSLTATAREKLDDDRSIVSYWFTVEGILDDEAPRAELFALLRI